MLKRTSLTPSRRADCSACNNISIRSLIIDGNRPLLLRVPKGEALVEMGNADGQEIRDCRLIEPRGWSALHFREGDWKSCSGGVIRNNVIVSGFEPAATRTHPLQGPAGEEWDEEYDGSEDPEPRFGNPRADGISLACKDSLVQGNVSCAKAHEARLTPRRLCLIRRMGRSSCLAAPGVKLRRTKCMLGREWSWEVGK